MFQKLQLVELTFVQNSLLQIYALLKRWILSYYIPLCISIISELQSSALAIIDGTIISVIRILDVIKKSFKFKRKPSAVLIHKKIQIVCKVSSLFETKIKLPLMKILSPSLAIEKIGGGGGGGELLIL